MNRAQPDQTAPIIAPEGLPIVAAFVVGSIALSWLAVWFLGTLGSIIALALWVLTLWCVWFFRDPTRRIPGQEDGKEPVISPADGVICFVGANRPPAELGLSDEQTRGMTRVSVFMNVFNVHVNRSPVAATVTKKSYRPGKFFNASFDKASEHNERMSIVLKTAGGRTFVCVQVAGLIARRIVCRVSEGATLSAAQRFGIIRFGSRVDVYLPEGMTPLVKVGDRSVAGETIFAWMAAAGERGGNGAGATPVVVGGMPAVPAERGA